jgi:hypothetical protein
MKLWHWIVIGVMIAGLFSGPGALEAGAAAQPPIEWSDIPFVFVGGVFGMIFVIGIQLFCREPKPSKWALWLLGPASLYFVASGLSAVFLAASHGGVTPYAVLFLAVGAGALLGVWVSWLFYRRRFKNAL